MSMKPRGLDLFQWPCGHGLLLRKRSLWRGRLWSRASARDETGLDEAGRKQRIESDLTRFVEVFQNGKFYTRQEAWRLAQETQQILHRVSGDEAHGGTLFSENLY